MRLRGEDVAVADLRERRAAVDAARRCCRGQLRSTAGLARRARVGARLPRAHTSAKKWGVRRGDWLLLAQPDGYHNRTLRPGTTNYRSQRRCGEVDVD
jgi:hypothetical protein